MSVSVTLMHMFASDIAATGVAVARIPDISSECARSRAIGLAPLARRRSERECVIFSDQV